ncbi:MAG: cache domain-containing protein [Methanoregula sp.]|nr:cache domain-containing protein [Methanoregula sp.]
MKAEIFSILVFLCLVAGFVVVAGCTGPAGDTQIAQMKGVATQLTVSIDAGLEDLKAGIRNNSRTLSTAGLAGGEAEKILAENLLRHPWAFSSLVISKEGVVMTAVPENYADMVGMDLSWQPQVQKANTDQVSIVSGVFLMAEGFTGISQSYPVFSPSWEYLGYTDITYAPDAFLGRQIRPVTDGTAYDVWVTQTDGTVIYDTTKEEIGKNLFSDPSYADPALQAIFTRIVKEPSGSGKYTFRDREWNRNVTKTAVWDTAGIDGAVWRVVVTLAGSEEGEKIADVTTPVAGTTDASYANLTGFVQEAAAYAKEHGKEASLKAFNDPNGAFIDGELYVFAYEMDGTVIALPYQQGLLGTVRTGISDSNGVEFIDGMVDVAREGGGSLYYIYPNPKDNYREEFKLSYVIPVNDEWFVGSGIYLPELPAGFNDTEQDELVKRVKHARDYAQANGADKSLADFNDLNGDFADGSRYIFAYGYNGTTLSLPFQPELIGSNRLDFSDAYGVKILNWEISTAQRGGGFVYVQYLNPDTGAAGLKLCYVTPVNDKWFVGSGIYTESL